MPQLVAFDIETTSADPQTARIIEVGVAGHGFTFCKRVNPEAPIEPGASKVTGITDDDVANVPPWSETAPAVFDLLGRGQLVAFNGLAFDCPVMARQLDELGLDASLVDPARVLDPLVWVRWSCRGWRNRKLTDVATRFGITTDGAHNAGHDCRMTLAVTKAMFDRKLIPAMLEPALELQAEIAPKLDAEFAEFGYWLYRDRSEPEVLRLGAGKHCGARLDSVDSGFLTWCMRKTEVWEGMTKATQDAWRQAVASHD